SVPLSVLPESLPIAAPPIQQPASFNASITGLNVGQIAGMGNTVSGAVSISLQAQAPRLTLSALNAQLRIEELNLTAGTIPIGQEGKSTITVRDGVARVGEFTITGPDTELVLAGTAQ